MEKTKQSGKSLNQLKEDREKAIRDLQNTNNQLVMLQGVIAYLNQEIKKLEERGVL